MSICRGEEVGAQCLDQQAEDENEEQEASVWRHSHENESSEAQQPVRRRSGILGKKSKGEERRISLARSRAINKVIKSGHALKAGQPGKGRRRRR